jgi:hypothetical protein
VRYLVEIYMPPRSQVALEACVGRATREAVRADATVRCLGTLLLPEDETCFLRYEADSAEAVRAAARSAGIEFDRVIEAREVTTGGDDDGEA